MQAKVHELKKETVRVPNEWGGRDAGKHFLISEADAFAVEWWAWRVALVLKGTTASIPDEVARMGMVGVAVRAINAVIAADVDQEKLKPLLDEMMTCVQMVRDPKAINKTTGRPVATPIYPGRGDIMETRTIGWLRSEVARLHTGFTPAAALSELISVLRKASEASSTT